MKRMSSGIAFFASAPVRLRNGDVEYEYRQDSDFYYLTGFEEPESFCVLAPGHSKHEYVLFVRPRDKEKEIWNGFRAGVEGAMERYGAELAYPIDRLTEILPEFLENAGTLYYQINKTPDLDQKIFAMVDSIRHKYRTGVYPPVEIVDPSRTLESMRAIKSPGEIALIQQAAEISARAHIAAMKSARPGMHEYEIQAVIEYVFRSNGASRNGYPSIVGSGPNTCILHYVENKRIMNDGDLLLIDAGAEYGYYTGDITRTYPVNGRFSAEQKAIYEVVLDAQNKAIHASRTGTSFLQVHETALNALTEGMIHLRLLEGSLQENLENKRYSKYFMHRTSHWLGMDVHDTGMYFNGNQSRILEPGMVMTVEPGIYVGEENNRFRNIGIRIEDDILIAEGDPMILSASCPKEIADLENIIGTGNAKLF